MPRQHDRPKSAYGESCTMCKQDAYHKVGEEFLDEGQNDMFMHNMTAYICCGCYFRLMGTMCEPKEEK